MEGKETRERERDKGKGRRQREGKETKGREGDKGKGRRQGEGKKEREGKIGKGNGRREDIIFSFPPNMREIFQKNEGRISYVFSLINSIEPIEFRILYFCTF